MHGENLSGGIPNGRLVRSTVDVANEDAADYWSDIVCRSLVKVAARPVSRTQFTGRIEHFTVDELGFSVVAAEAQEVCRTGRQIARGREDYAMINIQVSGQGAVSQDGRGALLTPGAMVFLDSTRPYTLQFDDAFSQLVVQVPRQSLPGRVLSEATAVEVSASGPGRLISDFLVGMERQHRLDPKAVSVLAPHAVGLVTSALSLASGTRPTEQSSAALTRERVQQFIRRQASDSSLDADGVAAACGISRRTLFRALSEAEGTTFTALLRQVRVENMRRALRDRPDRPLAILGQECGFAGEAQMYRAFREVTGTTPAAYRDAACGQGSD
ncbi:MAG TPA: AraC family transcriptional regulator [Trebonia sp.]|nr:AraC family transcriptional regulator [Trebonia sp.]